MKKPMISLKDTKSRVWQSPVVYDTVDAAMREACRAVTLGRDMRDGQKPLISMYPEDFELWHVSDFDSDTGLVSLLTGGCSVCVCNLSDLVKE